MDKQAITNLLKKMSTKEKIYQLVQLAGGFYSEDEAVVTGPKEKLGISDEAIANVGSILNVRGAEETRALQKNYLAKSDAKIPLLFMADIINGYDTIFPIPLGQGATWNPELIKAAAAVAAEEAAVSGIHVTFSPMVDLVRDPRWGRVMESTGEDTYLNSVYAQSFVEGYQGEMIVGKNVAACVKHFAAYGAPEGGREYNTVDMSERNMREYYLPAYQAALKAGAKMVMTSFNTVDGIPATGNKWLNQDVLRKEWGFEGILISDYAAIKELEDHGIAEDAEQAAKLALEASVDIDMMTSVYAKNLEKIVVKDSEMAKLLDQSVLRILELKNELGLFENPYRGADTEKAKAVILSKDNRKLARKVVSESLVLLKNQEVLPLKSTQKIALIGPYATSPFLSGSWSFSLKTERTVTLEQAFSEVLPAENLLVAPGCLTVEPELIEASFGQYFPAEKTLFDEEGELVKALEAARKSDVVVMAIGEHYLQSGEGGSRGELTLPRVQQKLISAIKALGKPMVGVVFSGRPLELKAELPLFDSLLTVWFPGTEGGHGIADVVFGKVNPSGKLSMSFPYSVGQVPVHYNEFNTGRPLTESGHSKRFTSRYTDMPNKPLFPFGFGLSYTTFSYCDFKLSETQLVPGDKITATVEVTNSGKIAGTETVQLYIRDLVGSVVRPVKELKGFQKIFLQPKETRKVSFEITEEMLRFYTRELTYQSESGEFTVFIGSNSEVAKGINFILCK